MRLLGTTQYDNDADVQQYRAQIATESLALWQTLNQAADRGICGNETIGYSVC